MTTATSKETPEDFNPYRAPKSNLDMLPEPDTGEWLRSGRVVPAKNGLLWIREAWRMLRDQSAVWLVALLPLAVCECFSFLSRHEWLVLLVGLVFGPLYGSVAAMAWRQNRGEAIVWTDIFTLRRDRLEQLLLLGALELFLLWGLPNALAYSGVFLLGMGIDPTPALTAAGYLLTPMPLCVTLGSIGAPTLIMLAERNALQAFGQSLWALLRNWRALLVNGLTPAAFLLSLIHLNPLDEANADFQNLLLVFFTVFSAFSALMDFAAARDLFHNAPNAPLSESFQQTITTGLPHEHD